MNVFNYQHLIDMITSTDERVVAGYVVMLVIISLLFAGVVVKKEETDEQNDWEEHVEGLCGIVNNISDFRICRIDMEYSEVKNERYPQGH